MRFVPARVEDVNRDDGTVLCDLDDIDIFIGRLVLDVGDDAVTV
jgi:hypothetical protein